MKILLCSILIMSVIYAQQKTEKDLRNLANKLAKEIIIIDTHIDLPGRLQEQWEDISKPTGGEIDYPRAKAGGLDVPFMSVYIAARFENNGAKEEADTMILLKTLLKLTPISLLLHLMFQIFKKISMPD